MWKEKALRMIRESGYKLTPQRVVLIEVLDRIGNAHPSLGEIHREVKKKLPTVSVSTLYSNILLLQKLELLQLLPLGGETHVEVNIEPHINLITAEGIRDIEDRELIRIIERKIGKKIRLVNVVV